MLRAIISLVLILTASPLYAETAADLHSAKRLAARIKKPVFIQWRGDDCPVCDAVNDKVLKDRAVARFLDRNFIRVEVNADRVDRKVSENYGVNSVPSSQVARSDWKLRKTLRNTLSPQDFIDQLKATLDRWGEERR